MSDLRTVSRSEDVAEPQPGRRKLKAVLAGGLVLGVGAAITLAAWNDSEFAGGPFGSGTFDLEGSVDGTNYGDHTAPTEIDAAILSFSLNPSNLSPGDVTYAPFAVRLDSATTYNASVAISPVALPPDVVVDNLTYELVQSPTFGCAADTTGTTLVPANTPLGTMAVPAAFNLVHGPMDGDGQTTGPGDPAYLCFKITAGPGLTQGQGGGAGWQFTATSQ